MRICPITGSDKWQHYYTSKNNRIITGDQRISEGKLEKIICTDSGVVANKRRFSSEELEVLYGKEYELNTLGKEEHFFYTNEGRLSRSEVFYNWILPHLPKKFESLVEIGCGEGNLLQRIKNNFQDKNISGIDGSLRASELAREKGLTVQQELIHGKENLSPTDVFLLINVIEHVEDISLVISKLKSALNNNGRIIFCLPIQDYGGYDIFFHEHVWHFTSQHFEHVLLKNGLSVLYKDFNHPINHGIGLYVCENGNNSLNMDFKYNDTIKNNLKIWNNRFLICQTKLREIDNKKIALFGAGEVATIFLAFTDLYKLNIIACIDDSKGEGTEKHDIPIYSSSWLEENKVDVLLLTVNEKYHDMVRDKLKHLNLNIKSIY